jgi:hypothetical protein
MPAVQVSKKHAALTANGTTGGIATIASNTGWLAGAIANLTADDQDPLEVKIVEQIGSTQLRLRATDSDVKARGGFTDISAYTTAQNARLSMAQQVVAAEIAHVGIEKA